MQTVVLEGELGNRFGKRWNTNCNRLLDIFKLIECQREGFRQYMMECNDAGIQFDIKRGDAYLEDESELLLKLNNDDVVVTPIPAGSKGAAGKLIAAIIIIYDCFIFHATYEYTADQPMVCNFFGAHRVSSWWFPGVKTDPTDR